MLIFTKELVFFLLFWKVQLFDGCYYVCDCLCWCCILELSSELNIAIKLEGSTRLQLIKNRVFCLYTITFFQGEEGHNTYNLDG